MKKKKKQIHNIEKELQNLLDENKKKDNIIQQLNQGIVDLGNELVTKTNELNNRENIISNLSNDKQR